jgi:hypothetical protein
MRTNEGVSAALRCGRTRKTTGKMEGLKGKLPGRRTSRESQDVWESEVLASSGKYNIGAGAHGSVETLVRCGVS